jgi:hypothetical protein
VIVKKGKKPHARMRRHNAARFPLISYPGRLRMVSNTPPSNKEEDEYYKKQYPTTAASTPMGITVIAAAAAKYQKQEDQ